MKLAVNAVGAEVIPIGFWDKNHGERFTAFIAMENVFRFASARGPFASRAINTSILGHPLAASAFGTVHDHLPLNALHIECHSRSMTMYECLDTTLFFVIRQLHLSVILALCRAPVNQLVFLCRSRECGNPGFGILDSRVRPALDPIGARE